MKTLNDLMMIVGYFTMAGITAWVLGACIGATWRIFVQRRDKPLGPRSGYLVTAKPLPGCPRCHGRGYVPDTYSPDFPTCRCVAARTPD